MPAINGLETEKLLDIVETVKRNWKTGKTVWTASARWRAKALVNTQRGAGEERLG